MNPVSTQQVALDNALVALEKRLKIEKCNMRIKFNKPQRKTTYQVTLDVLKLSPCYPTFPITAEVPKIYMHQFWNTIKKIKDTDANQFKLDNKNNDTMPHSLENIYTVIKSASLGESIGLEKTLVLEGEPAKKPKWTKHPEHAKKSAPAKKDVSSKKPSRKLSTGGANSESEVPDEPKGKSIDTSEGTGLKPGVPDVSKTDSSKNENESWGDSGDEANEQGDDKADEQSDDDHEQADDERTKSDDEEEETQDEYVHTPEDYVPTDDETNDVTKEEYKRINEEIYGDVNVSLTDAEPADKEKDDEEITVAGHVNVNQEGAGNQVKDDAQATQKTEGPIPSSSISSNYVAKYLNFDNIPPVNKKVVSMLDINVQHEIPHTSHLLTIPVFIIPEHTVANPPEIDVKELKDVDNSSKVISTIQSDVLKIVKEYLGSSMEEAKHKQYAPHKSVEDIQEIKMEHARKQQVPKETITSSDTTALEEFDQKTNLFETTNKSKSFNKSPKQRALYHALMESILEDEDVMEEGVVDNLKKTKLDDADKDEGPSAGSDRGLKRRKISKETEPSKKAKSTETFKGTSKGTSKSQPKSTNKQDIGNTDDQPNVKDAPKHDCFKKPKRPTTHDSDWNVRKSVDFRPPQTWISKIAQAEKLLISFDELMSTPIDFSVTMSMNHLTQ
ncbi:hypothetical protein Tco_0323224 [Tanacetum coccineum]